MKPSVKRVEHVRQMLAFDAAFPGFGTRLAGMDEVGRGPLVGNVVTACVIMPETPVLDWMDDSKKLSAARREEVYQQIQEIAIYIGIGQATAAEIDEMNILNATRLAMERAAANAPACFCLVDAVRDLYLPFPFHSLVKGDATSYAIAASSIVAKVTRDRQMCEYARLYPQYGFDRHMGYGTPEHIAALRKYGPTPEHRRSFIKNFCSEEVTK